MIETTPKQFKVFKKSARKWAKRLGLTQYRLDFERRPLGDAYATCMADGSLCVATMAMTSAICDDEVKLFDPKGCGKHEALHLLISRMHMLGQMRFIRNDELDEENEAIVRRLEKVL